MWTSEKALIIRFVKAYACAWNDAAGGCVLVKVEHWLNLAFKSLIILLCQNISVYKIGILVIKRFNAFVNQWSINTEERYEFNWLNID